MYIFYLNCRIEVNLKNNSQCSNGTIPIVLSGMYSARPGKGHSSSKNSVHGLHAFEIKGYV